MYAVLAQAIDPDDFVHVWGMAGWMSTYERMVNHFVTGVLATNEEMVAHMRIAGWTAPNLQHLWTCIWQRGSAGTHWWCWQHSTICGSSTTSGICRTFLTKRKQPGFFMDLIEMYGELTSEPCEFAIYSGGPLRSNNPEYVTRARAMEAEGKTKDLRQHKQE
jgi:hypothetical protein